MDEKTTPCELGPSGPVSELEVLAALARSELQATTRYPGLEGIAHHLGWRFSGQATRHLRPKLDRLTAAGLVATEDPRPHEPRRQEWTITPAGRLRLAAAAPIDLPESPQHRRWRQDRDVAAWALDAARSQAWDVHEEVYGLLSVREDEVPSLTDGFVKCIVRRFGESFAAFALAIRMCEQWPEPSDLSADEHAPGTVADLLPETARGGRRT
jgi:Transcriptional regulator PadR-like family